MSLTRSFKTLQVGLVALSVSTCGGSDGGGRGPTEPPAVAAVEVSPTEATIDAGSTQQFTAIVRDGGGTALTGRTTSWSSSNNAVATVSSAGLATGVGEGAATITASSEGVSGTAQLTVELGAFSPMASTSLSGNQFFSEVDIPAGVTVTAS